MTISTNGCLQMPIISNSNGLSLSSRNAARATFRMVKRPLCFLYARICFSSPLCVYMNAVKEEAPKNLGRCPLAPNLLGPAQTNPKLSEMDLKSNTQEHFES